MRHKASNSRRALRFNCVLSAHRQRVYRAWTNPADLQKWFRPELYRAVSIQVNARPGGKYRFEYEFEPFSPHKIPIEGEFLNVDPSVKLAYTWNLHVPDGPPSEPETRVTVNFLGLKDSTQVRVVHQGFSSTDSVNWHKRLWRRSLEHLERFLKGRGFADHSKLG